jgi:hypothetical protein
MPLGESNGLRGGGPIAARGMPMMPKSELLAGRARISGEAHHEATPAVTVLPHVS